MAARSSEIWPCKLCSTAPMASLPVTMYQPSTSDSGKTFDTAETWRGCHANALVERSRPIRLKAQRAFRLKTLLTQIFLRIQELRV